MTWEGRIKWSAPMAGGVRLGDLLVPRKVTMSLTGEDGSPNGRFEFEMSPLGEARCIGVEISATASGRGISTADLALVAVDQLTEQAFAELAQKVVSRKGGGNGSAYSGGVDAVEAAPIRRALDRGKQAMREELATVAHVYSTAQRAPLQAVEHRFPHYSRRTAARRVQAARDHGFLPEKGQETADEHREAIERALSDAGDLGRLDAFETTEAFDAWRASRLKGGADNG